MHTDAAAVFDQAKISKAVHKTVGARSRRADHRRQSLLRDFGNQGVRALWLSAVRHHEQSARGTLFTGIEKLIDEVRPGAHTAALQRRVGPAPRKGTLFRTPTLDLRLFLCNYGYLITAVIVTFGSEVNMGVLLKMPEPRFERTPFKMHGGSVILSKCKNCGARRLGSFADGSVHAWEKKHRCESASAASVTQKEIG